MNNVIEQFKRFELTLHGPYSGNPFTDINLLGIFEHNGHKSKVRGFYDGGGKYKIRFMPEETGEWNYTTESNSKDLDGVNGNFEVTAATSGNHGKVQVINTSHFGYMDGNSFLPMGTTAYAWVWQPENVQKQTLTTLKENSFNKIRMTVFPKYYNYNTNEPNMYPFEGDYPQSNKPFAMDDWYVDQKDIKFDFSRPNPRYFQHLEKRIDDLDKLGIQADLILFHPYDHWGFARMGKKYNHQYLKYVVARLASFKNIWWSMANEYDLMDMYNQINVNDWDDLCKVVYSEDPSQHLLSIHNFYDTPRHQLSTSNWYDQSKPWITHLSIQNYIMYMAAQWTEDYQKPVIYDECRYEGNIEMGWGDLSAEILVQNFWKLMCHGAYASHGETYLDKPNTDRPIWWAHGGKLYGKSPARLNYLYNLFIKYNLEEITPIGINTADWELYAGINKNQDTIVVYFSDSQPRFENLPFLPDNQVYKATLIDTWNMKSTDMTEQITSDTWFELPQRKYQALILENVKKG